jgi:hypothetical protein
MPTAILNDPDWIRTAEILYRGQEYTGELLDPAINNLVTPVLPGMVAVVQNGVVKIAADGGDFFGLFLSEHSARLDESDKKTIPPVLIRGPGTVRVWNTALDSGSTFALAAGNVVDLTAKGGKLSTTAGAGLAKVASLTQVLPDSIIVQLNAPTTV